MQRLPRYRTGDPDVDALVAQVVDRSGTLENQDLIFELMATAVRLARANTNRGDLKIANAALKEMRNAFGTFAPYRSERKVAIFGSARTKVTDPLYAHARDLASALVAQDWMVITGAGPGIMSAGIEGAGAETSFGVGIRLPFEATTSSFIADDPKLVNFRYFFTRKLTFIKESSGFVLLPGGFGTMDEAFELLTLVQTGKSNPAPIVLLDVPGVTYWDTWAEFVERELMAPGYVSPEDMALVKITDSIDEAVQEVTTFYRNYHSQRFVGSDLVIRTLHPLTSEALEACTQDFADIIVDGKIEAVETTAAERADDDQVDLARIAFHFDRHHWARLRQLIDRINDPSAFAAQS